MTFSRTVQEVHDLLPMTPGLLENSRTLSAVRYAIAESWPWIRTRNYVAAIDTGPMVNNATTYSLATYADITERGVKTVFIENRDNYPPVIVRHWRPIYPSGVLTLEFANRLTSKWAGKDIGIAYWSRVADVTTVGATPLLPLNYMLAFCSWWYAYFGFAKPESGRGTNESRLVVMQERYERALQGNAIMDNELMPGPDNLDA